MAGLVKEHELHRRRKGRNMGVGLVLVAFIALIFGLTIVKVGGGDYQARPETEVQDGN
ncbi:MULTISPECIES: hypothetical protein [Ponticoccus]|uniref:Cytochrome C oxidase assembly protein n=1 Tax=Ponticoccus litoralis TaxID=422297 RepID=A0AAW9SKJ1_9RHOB